MATKKKLLESAIAKIVRETLKENPMMIDIGGETERQLLLRDVMESLTDAEETRERLIQAMKTETDPVERITYQQALEKFNAVIKDQHDLIKTLAKGAPTLRGKRLGN